ncbi:hypothetical protein AMS68_000596 [Peltaster fructicola]|uniref:Uncharacterized protein n=1 Tax=Peltaster fructicola TaxID=286661 RepID=A0A6H0XKC2_9PEZI|nr:hypothetical protein AMS68_000596 [Peltaster fructicola]
MCIAIVSTAHPTYPFILLSNRDEFLTRPTARVDWWQDPHSHVLGPRDLQKQEQGTWLGITSDGRFAVLTNFRDEGVEVTKDKSRGGIVTAWLQPQPESAPSVDQFADHLIHEVGINDVGGFSLLFGQLSRDHKDGLTILSNRSTSSNALPRIARHAGETHGLSNSHYGDLTWPKVVHGEMLLKQAITANVSRGDSKEKLIQSLFDVLCVDTLPKRQEGETWVSFVRQLRNSILIPPVGGNTVDKNRPDSLASGTTDDGSNAPLSITNETAYGTHKQTIILVDTEGKVNWIERTLYDEQAQPVPTSAQDVHIDFQIKGWET